MGNHHNHNHPAELNIKIAFWLNVSFALIEIAGGIFTNSIAILSNAFHDLGDSVALALAWYFQRVSTKERNEMYTYGYKRYSLVGAVISAGILLIGSIIIISQAIPRIISPEEVHKQGMFYLALAGIFINGIAMMRLRGGHSQNEKVISIHLLEDILGWVAVLLASLIMKYIDLPILDPILSLSITAFILFRVFGSMRQTFRIFMQAIPSKDQITKIKLNLSTIDGVNNVHDMHFWTLDGSYNIASLHVCVDPSITVLQTESIRQKVRLYLKNEGFEHSTIEVEPEGKLCELNDC
jgi:cobalt-zinc-cadmium efflux system protein